MRKNAISCYFLLVVFLFSTNVTKAVIRFSPAKKQYNSVYELKANDLINLDRKSLEKKINRKLNLKERITLRFVKRRLKKLLKNTNPAEKNATDEVKVDGLAIAGFVSGVLSFFIFGIVFSILAIVFSAIALKRIKSNPEVRKGKGLAVAGLVLGIVAAAVLLLAIGAAI